MVEARSHRWRFFYAGGFEQVEIESPTDLIGLRTLDQKLWASLACPTEGLEFDRRLLDYIDDNNDSRIRAPELLNTIDWMMARVADPMLLFQDRPVMLEDFADNDLGAALVITAKRLLSVLERPITEGVTAADTDDLKALFPASLPNGDGLIPASLTSKEPLKQAIKNIITCLGSQQDRSGEAAISADTIHTFFEQAKKVYQWQQKANGAQIEGFAEQTAGAAALLDVVREKIDDFFNRVELVAFDPRAAELINGEETELVRLSGLSLADPDKISQLPLAHVSAEAVLPLNEGINPAWQEKVQLFQQYVVQPVLGDTTSLSQQQWRQLKARFAPYFAWLSAKPDADILNHLAIGTIYDLVENQIEDQLLALVEQDKAVADAANGLLDLDKFLRCQRGLVRLLKNFISFQHFYSHQRQAIFQAGTLYIDGKSCDLAVEVKDIEAHAAVATNSNNYLLYCVCTRRGQPVRNRETMNIAVAVTAGSQGGLVVGRNGLFYDREGNDWDATVVKVLANPISIREAFWSPYRRIATNISEQIQKFAANRDSEVVSKATASVGEKPAAGTSEGPKAFDIAKFAGVFAAIGLAMAALGAALASIMAGLRALLWWQWPLVFLGIILFVSGPSMLLAWFKLRRRNLGPILDANGWAVNTKAKINIKFGARLTQLAKLPPGAVRTFSYTSSNPRRLYSLLFTLLVVASLATYFAYKNKLWWFG